MTDAERIAELEETIRQMREAFAEPFALPLSWHFPPYERQVLQGLLARPTFGPAQYRYFCEAQGGYRDDRRNLSVVVWRVRNKLKQYAGEAMVKTKHRIGFYIEPRDKARLRLMIETELQRERNEYANRARAVA